MTRFGIDTTETDYSILWPSWYRLSSQPDSISWNLWLQMKRQKNRLKRDSIQFVNARFPNANIDVDIIHGRRTVSIYPVIDHLLCYSKAVRFNYKAGKRIKYVDIAKGIDNNYRGRF